MASPIIPATSYLTMAFPEAIEEMIDGNKITREEWDNKKEYGFLLNERLTIHTKGKDHTWLVSEADMVAKDWIVI